MDSPLPKELSFDNFDEEYLKKTCASIYDDDNHFERFERRIYSSILDCIRQALDKKLIIHVPANLYEIVEDSRGNFVQTTLKHFLPKVEEKVILAMSKSVQSTTSGLDHCSFHCFKFENLLDQAEKALFFPSKKHIQFYLDLPVNTREIEAITPDRVDRYISPYAKSQEEEELVSTTMARTRNLLDGDLKLSHLLNMLALFSPVNVDMSTDDYTSLKFFQEKITMMIYTHLMKRWETNIRKVEGKIFLGSRISHKKYVFQDLLKVTVNIFFRTGNINSLNIMTSLVSMMSDFNTVGKIIAESMIRNDEDAVDLENININY